VGGGGGERTEELCVADSSKMGLQTDLVVDFLAGSVGAATSVYVGQPLGKPHHLPSHPVVMDSQFFEVKIFIEMIAFSGLTERFFNIICLVDSLSQCSSIG
jgi:hypothetical protein